MPSGCWAARAIRQSVMVENLQGLEQRAAALAASAGFAGPIQLEPVPGGRNNRAFVLHAGQQRAFLKAYFRHPDDPRDRLHSETALLAHAEALSIDAVTRVLGLDRKAGLALFRFVEGRRLESSEVRPEHVEAALNLYLALNQAVSDLPVASEACFSLGEHLACVERRVERLLRAAGQGHMREDGAIFVMEELAPAWRRLRETILAEASGLLGQSWAAPLRDSLRRVSPSDFGFHNALRTAEGRLVFIDFEYAGLDDPAKLVCDFFCQPEVPVDRRHLPGFLARVAQASPGDAGLTERVRLLLPAYGLKWCCIMLNDFLPLGAARRDYAEGGEAEARRDRQLTLARRSLTYYTTR